MFFLYLTPLLGFCKLFHRLYIWAARDQVNKWEVKDLVKDIRKSNPDQKIVVLSGVHGYTDGGLSSHVEFLQQDIKNLGNMSGVEILDVMDLVKNNPDKLKQIVTSPDTHVVAAWCYSEGSQDLLKALGYVE